MEGRAGNSSEAEAAEASGFSIKITCCSRGNGKKKKTRGDMRQGLCKDFL